MLKGEGPGDHVRKLIELDLAQEEARQTSKSFDEALSVLTEGLHATRAELRARRANNGGKGKPAVPRIASLS
jgi:hypothetical protein